MSNHEPHTAIAADSPDAQGSRMTYQPTRSQTPSAAGRSGETRRGEVAL